MTRRCGLLSVAFAALFLTSLKPALASGQSVDPSTGTVDGTSTPTPAATAGLVHHRFGRLGLDAPTGWEVRPGREQRYGRILGFIGTAPSVAGCTEVPVYTGCGIDFALEPGTVSLKIEEVGGPIHLDAFERTKDPPPGTSVVTVDGVSALRIVEPDTDDPSAVKAITLYVPFPDGVLGGTRIEARVLGPGGERLWQQVEDVLASVRYEPPLRATDRMDRAAARSIVRRTLDRLDDPAHACFPRRPGRSREAVVRHVGSWSRLGRPLRVTCTTEIEGTPLELWKLTLRTTWSDRPCRRRGSSVDYVWIGLDGDYMTLSPGGRRPCGR